MANGIPFYDNLDLNQNEMQNAGFEKLAVDPTGGDLFESRVWLNTAEGLVKVYRNSEIKILAFLSDIGGSSVGGHDATTGIPTTGTGPGGAILAGDTWYITTAGTIAGIGGDDKLDISDLLVAIADGANAANLFIGKQRNLDDSVIANGEVTTVSLVAATPLTITASNFSGNILNAEVYRTDGRQIKVRKTLGGSANQIILRSNNSLANVSVRLIGLNA